MNLRLARAFILQIKFQNAIFSENLRLLGGGHTTNFIHYPKKWMSKCHIYRFNKWRLLNLKSNRGNYLISLIKNELGQAKQTGVVVDLFWMPAHKGITGNQIADQLAKEECSSNNHLNYRISFSDLQSLSRNKH